MKKAEELRWLLRAMEINPSIGRYPVCVDEAPDFYFRDGAGITGIEITQLFHISDQSVPLQARERYIEEMRDSLESTFSEMNLPAVWICVQLDPTGVVSRERRSKLLAEIIRVVTSNIPEIDGRREVEWSALTSSLWDSGLHSISIRRPRSITKVFCSFPQARFLPPLNAEVIKSVATRKERRITDYLRKVDRTILLVVAESQGLSGMFDFDESLKSSHVTTRFSGLFLFLAFSGKVLTFNCSKPEASAFN